MVKAGPCRRIGTDANAERLRTDGCVAFLRLSGANGRQRAGNSVKRVSPSATVRRRLAARSLSWAGRAALKELQWLPRTAHLRSSRGVARTISVGSAQSSPHSVAALERAVPGLTRMDLLRRLGGGAR